MKPILDGKDTFSNNSSSTEQNSINFLYLFFQYQTFITFTLILFSVVINMTRDFLKSLFTNLQKFHISPLLCCCIVVGPGVQGITIVYVKYSVFFFIFFYNAF
jgi:hypothetical protein